jgi:hypothetical protein
MFLEYFIFVIIYNIYMYTLSVLAMFKNESTIIQDWIEHYLAEGVEHFYLIDNGSTDNTLEKIPRYTDYVTLVKDPRRLEYGTQSVLFHERYLHMIKSETEWLIICDVDEYIYARNKCVQIMDVLKKLPLKVSKIWLPWKCFGSNGHKTRRRDILKQLEYGKVICRTKYLIKIASAGHMVELTRYNAYYLCNGNVLDLNKCKNSVFADSDLHLNHYQLMSEEYYKDVKCVRGGGESGHTTNKFTMPEFYRMDETFNEVEDTELANKKYRAHQQMPKI